MHDLLYLDRAENRDHILAQIKAKWPEVQIEPAGDGFYPYRYSITIDTLTEDDWLAAVLLNRISLYSFWWQMTWQLKPDKAAAIMRAVAAYLKHREGKPHAV